MRGPPLNRRKRNKMSIAFMFGKQGWFIWLGRGLWTFHFGFIAVTIYNFNIDDMLVFLHKKIERRHNLWI